MTAAPFSPPRLLSTIAGDILAEIDQPYLRKALPYVTALTKLQYINNAADYTIVAAARRALGPWRSKPAALIKRELETILTLYRVDSA